jgi:hypothetical protein
LNVIDPFINQRPQGLLFHYTTADGMLKILRESSIWASSAYHLNDAAEFRYALNLIKDRLRLRLKSEHGPMNAAYGGLLSSLQGMTSSIQVFIASFSEHGDVLSQWLAYSGSNGYSLSIESQELDVAIESGFRLVRCVYKLEEQTALAEAFIDAYTNAPIEADDRTSVLTKALVVAAAIKHGGFAMECEWRLVKPVVFTLQEMPAVLFRPGRNGIVPYVNVPLSSGGAEYQPNEIYIGPNADMPAASAAFRTFLNCCRSSQSGGIESESAIPRRRFTEQISVKESETPYRP